MTESDSKLHKVAGNESCSSPSTSPERKQVHLSSPAKQGVDLNLDIKANMHSLPVNHAMFVIG